MRQIHSFIYWERRIVTWRAAHHFHFALRACALALILSLSQLLGQTTGIGPTANAALPPGSTWSWENPLPQNNNLRGVSCPTVTTCFVVGDFGTIMQTRNGGSLWTAVGGPGRSLHGINCPSTSACVAVGDAGTILSTTDGGVTWTPQNSGTTLTLSSVSCPSMTSCFVVGNIGTILVTTNGGSVWTSRNSGTIDSLINISCPSETTCFTGGSAMLVTTDGGASWTPQNAVGSAVSCPNVNTCIGFGEGSTDGGNTWVSQALPVLGGFLALSCPTPSNCVGVGSTFGFGLIIATSDGGTTWTVQPNPAAGSKLSLSGIDCRTASHCVVVGDHGELLATTDEGASWVLQLSGSTQDLAAISCPSLANCFAAAVLPRSGVLATADGGNTWTPQTASPEDLLGVSCPSVTTCFAAGGGNMVLATTNAGGTWTIQNTGNCPISCPNFGGISCPTTTTCFAAGAGYRIGGVVLATVNGGQTWVNQIPNFTQNGLSAISCSSPIMCVAAGQGGTIVTTNNGGGNWIPRGSGTTLNITGVSCPSMFVCFAVGSDPASLLNGIVLGTTDGGITWTKRNTWTPLNLNGVNCPSTSMCFAVGVSGFIIFTIDGGTTWATQGAFPFPAAALTGVSCQSTACHAVGSLGTILANLAVPAQLAGRGFGLTAGPLPLLDSALLSWSAGTEQTGYHLLRFDASSVGLAELPPGGSPLPAPVQSYQDTDSLTDTLYCYALVPVNGATTLGTSDPLCLSPHVHSATGAPPTLTVRLDQTSTASLNWTAPGGQDGYVLLVFAADGTRRAQFLSATAVATTDATGGQPTCYVLLPTSGVSVLGNSDIECALPGVATTSAAAGAVRNGAPNLVHATGALRRTVESRPTKQRLLSRLDTLGTFGP
jgi:photosystem II stability/assembly factor-like uncharacterized protein